MKKLTGLGRVLTAIHHQEPDMVPTFENEDIDENLRNKIKPGLSYEDFIDYMDLDAIVYYDMADQKYERLDDKGYVRDQWGAIMRWTPGSLICPYPIETPIKSEKDLDSYIPPDPDLPWRYKRLEKAVQRFKGERAVIETVMDPFQTVRDCLRGLDQYLADMVENPDLVDRLNEIARDYHRRFVNNCIDVGVDIIWMTGDIATSQGPFVSPKMTERFIIPGIREIAEIVHSRGLPFLKHSDGNIMKVLDMLIDAGVDAIDPIDTVAGMDLGEVKAKYGDKICLMGNVDCTYIMTWGTTGEVREDVKRCMRQAAKGGGYICHASSMHPAVKPENYVAMVEAIREYGKYPLSF